MESVGTESQKGNLPSTVRWVVYGALVFLVGVVLLAPLVIGTHEPGYPPKALSEIRNLHAAIRQFEMEYNVFPVARSTIQRCRETTSDFTFGIPASLGLANAHADNAEAMNLLLAREKGPNRELLNSRKIRFMELKQARSTNDSGLGPDGVYRDPWGNPYIITLDLNGDGYCEDALYSRPAVSSNTVSKPVSLEFELSETNPNSYRLKAEIMIWSLGRDGKADPKIPANEGVNADNILSWE